MKFLMILVLMSFGSQVMASSKNNNPQMRACRTTGGLFHAISTEADQYGFCEYDSALVDSISILNNLSGVKSQAVTALSAQYFVAPENCKDTGSVEVAGSDVEGKKFELCQFGDGSLIEKATLLAGIDAPANCDLKAALEIKH